MEYLNRVKDGLRSLNPAALIMEDSDEDDDIYEQNDLQSIDTSRENSEHQTKDTNTNNNSIKLIESTSPKSFSEDSNSSNFSNLKKLEQKNENLFEISNFLSNFDQILTKYQHIKEMSSEMPNYTHTTTSSTHTQTSVHTPLPTINKTTNKFDIILQITQNLANFSEQIILQQPSQNTASSQKTTNVPTFENLKSEVDIQKQIIQTHYHDIAQYLNKIREENEQLYREEFIQLRSSSQFYRDSYQSLLSEYKQIINELQNTKNNEENKNALFERSGLLDQIKLLQENYVSISNRLEALTEEKKASEQHILDYDLTKKRMEELQLEVDRINPLYESLYEAEKTIFDKQTQIENLHVELTNTNTALHHINEAFDELQKQKEEAASQYNKKIKNLQNEIQTLQLQSTQKDEEITKISKIKSEFEIQNLNLKKLQNENNKISQENDNFCQIIKNLNTKIEIQNEERSNFVDKQLLTNILIQHSKQKQKSGRDELFKLLSEVLDLSNKDISDLGVQNSSESKPLSTMFIEYLHKETNF